MTDNGETALTNDMSPLISNMLKVVFKTDSGFGNTAVVEILSTRQELRCKSHTSDNKEVSQQTIKVL